jgi:hypothetical protein
MNIHCIFSKAFSEIQIRVLSLSKMKDIAGAAERFESATFVASILMLLVMTFAITSQFAMANAGYGFKQYLTVDDT